MILAACGGSDSSSGTAANPGTAVGIASLSGYVADGYLRSAEIFLDINGNFQWDEGEPKTISGPGGYYTLTGFDPTLMQYPVVVRAIPGTTIDEDSPTQPITNSYILCAPAGATNFISPISTLVQEKMTANPGMTLADAAAQVRTDLGLPTRLNIMADYVAGSRPGQVDQASCQTLHTVAQQMVSLMTSQSTQVLNGSSVNVVRYRGMLNALNASLTGLSQNVATNAGTQSTYMNTMRGNMQTYLASQTTTSSTAAVPYGRWNY